MLHSSSHLLFLNSSQQRSEDVQLTQGLTPSEQSPPSKSQPLFRKRKKKLIINEESFSLLKSKLNGSYPVCCSLRHISRYPLSRGIVGWHIESFRGASRRKYRWSKFCDQCHQQSGDRTTHTAGHSKLLDKDIQICPCGSVGEEKRKITIGYNNNKIRGRIAKKERLTRQTPLFLHGFDWHSLYESTSQRDPEIPGGQVQRKPCG